MKPKHLAKKTRASELLNSGMSKLDAAAKLQEEFGIGSKAAWALVFNSDALDTNAAEPTPPQFMREWLSET